MAESSEVASIAAEDQSIAQLGREIAFSTLHAPPAHGTPQTSTYRDKPSAPIAYKRAPKRTGSQASTQSREGARSKTDSTAPHPSSSRSKPVKSPQQHTVQHVSPTESSNNAEPNDTELEEKLKSLVRVLTTSGSYQPDSSTSNAEFDTIKENFEWLILLIAQRASQQGPLSPSRHQFALFLIALHRRDERRQSLHPGSKSLFQVQWTSELLKEVLDLLLTTISSSYSPSTHIVHLDSLRALSLVLFDTAKHYSAHYTRLIACLRPLCDVKIVLDKEVQRVAFNCLANMCYKSGTVGQAHYEEIWAVFIRQSSQLQPQVLTQISFTRVFSALLRGIQFVIPEAKAIHEPGLPSLVSMLHKFIFYGTSLSSVSSALGAPISTSPIPFAGSVASFNAPPSLSDGDENDDDPISTGSEYSGSDVYSDKHGLWKVRYHSLGCLQALARASSEKFIQFWAHLLPQSSHQPSLISIVQIDSVHQVRSAACRLLSAMFDGQHSFLDASNARRSIRAPPSPNTVVPASNVGSTPQSPSSDPTTSSSGPLPSTPKKSSAASSRSPATASPKSFTPLSMQLSSMLSEVHSGLYKALAAETRPTTIIAIVKTFAILAQETPYDTLTSGILTKLLLHLQRFVLEGGHDPRLIRAAISALASCIGARSTSSEVESFLLGSNSVLVSDLESRLTTESNSSVKTELFRFFSSLAAHFPLIIMPHWESIFKAILSTTTGEEAQEHDPNTRHAASKCVDDLSRTLLHRLAVSPPADNRALESFTTSLWLNILNSRITELMVKDRFGLVRSSICNLFSQIPPSIFANLSRKQQVICITLLLGATNDDVPAVRAQAARALGLYILNNALKMDPLFVSDVALALVSAMKDKNLNVRVKAAWSAANLCDSLVTLREGPTSQSLHPDEEETSTKLYDTNHPNDSSQLNGENDESNWESGVEDLPRETLITLVKTLLHLHKDNDKVRCNAVRALGNFIRFTTAKVFEGEASLLVRLTETLLQLTREGSAKVRWNSCYALANLFHNPYIVANQHQSCTRAVETLLHVLNNSTNFKVRINAATALYFAFSSGVLDGDVEHVISIVEALVATLSSIDALEKDSVSSADLRYRESLHEQLRTLAVGCLIRMRDKKSLLDATSACRRNSAVLETLLRSDLEAPSQTPSASDEPENAQKDDQDESSSHSQLKPPSTLELRVLAQEALDYLISLSRA